MFHFPKFPHLFLHNVEQGCSFTLSSTFFPSITEPLSPSTVPFFAFSMSFPIFPISPLYLLCAIFQLCFHIVYRPLRISSPPQFSFPSLPLPQIWFDIHSPPGLNHQGLLVGPNHGSVSPQRGFCLLAVETNDLHALSLLSPHPHLEALEPIKVMRSTRQATAHSYCVQLQSGPGLLCFRCRHSCRVTSNSQELDVIFCHRLKDINHNRDVYKPAS